MEATKTLQPEEKSAQSSVENQYGNRSDEVLRHQSLLDDYLTYVSLNRSDETVDYYKGKLRGLLRAWDGLPPERWTKVEFERYVALAKAGKVPGQLISWGTRSVQMFLTAAKLFGEWCLAHDVPIPGSKEAGWFWSSVKKPKATTKEASFYTLDEAKRLIEAAYESRFELAIALAIGAGMRRGDVQRALWEDIDWEKRTILVRRNKTNLHHRVSISPVLWDVLSRRKQDVGQIVPGKLNNYTRDLQKFAAMAKVKYRPLHSLRHGFATELITRGAPLNTVMKFGGWTQLKTVTRYTHVLPDEMAKAAALLA